MILVIAATLASDSGPEFLAFLRGAFIGSPHGTKHRLGKLWRLFRQDPTDHLNVGMVFQVIEESELVIGSWNIRADDASFKPDNTLDSGTCGLFGNISEIRLQALIGP